MYYFLNPHIPLLLTQQIYWILFKKNKQINSIYFSFCCVVDSFLFMTLYPITHNDKVKVLYRHFCKFIKNTQAIINPPLSHCHTVV